MGIWKDTHEIFYSNRRRYLIFVLIALIYIFLFASFLYSINIDPLIPALIVVVMIFLIPVFMLLVDVLFYESDI